MFAWKDETLARVVIKDLHIEDVSRFRELKLTFNPSFNLLCGANGIGKSSILNIISAFFLNHHMISDLKRNALATSSGKLRMTADLGQGDHEYSGTLDAFQPGEQASPFSGNLQAASQVIYLRTNRDFAYKPLPHIAKDHVLSDPEAQGRMLTGVSGSDIKNWFANRWLFQPHSQHWPEYQKKNLAAAVKCFSMLDEAVSLSHVDSASFEIIVNTRSGQVPYEYLSSGFRASYTILLGIIQEIEQRDVERSAELFSGLILVDELDLHLHPTWQQRLPKVLRTLFPNAQIIATTHSPHMVQSAEAGEVIALVEDAQGDPVQAPLPSSLYGFKGWTVEEILSDVMGLPDVATSEYRQAVAQFDRAMDLGDVEATMAALQLLEGMLHPSSSLRKLLRIQAASVGVELDTRN